MTADKRIFVIAGPNGADKTTFATEYRVKPFFLRLPTPEAAIARVAQRVSEGGHDVPKPVIRRRFHAGWRNFEHRYRDLVDVWAVYDNSGPVPVLVAEESRE